MSVETGQPNRVEELLDRGLRNLWYPVLPGWALREAPLGITRLGEAIVLWRDGDGAVHAVEDRCPHRGARLSLGWNLGDRLACWYHGVEVDHAGRVRDVPAAASCAMVGQKRVRSYPAREIAGGIFLYFGDALHPEPVPFEPPAELTDTAAWSTMLCTAHWRCNYRFAIDNVMDPMHGAYLHAASHSMAEGDKSAEMRVRPTEAGFVFEKTGQRDVNFDWVEFGETGAHWLRLSIPYRRQFGPGGNFGIVGFATPVDAANCMVFFWRTRQVAGWQRDVWRFLYRNRLEGLHWAVLEQDRIILENLAPAAREREFLYQHDVGLGRVRNLLRARAREQIEALAASGAADRAAAARAP